MASRAAKKKRRRQRLESGVAAPASKPAAPTADPEVAAERPAVVTGLGERMRHYRSALAIPAMLSPVVATGTVTATQRMQAGLAPDGAVLVMAIAVYTLIALCFALTIRAARRRQHSWARATLRGVGALGLCALAIAMGASMSSVITGVPLGY